MEIEKLEIEGVFGIKSSANFDQRGAFLRIWNSKDFDGKFELSQVSASTNSKPRTLRGLHFQSAPHEESKIVLCVLGSVFDVVVDLRKESRTFGQYASTTIGLNENYQGIVVPAGFAHGYLTLEANATLVYFIDRPYVPESFKGIVWNDPKLQIAWPFEPEIISERDRNLPMLKYYE
jgi:dTDP-4-dehydrorhamnose 3,5-epimerase